MKIFIYILLAVALFAIAYTSTMLDFDNLMEGESAVALICILAAACAMVLLVILLVSRKISKTRSIK